MPLKIAQELEFTLEETLDWVIGAVRESNFSIISKLDISPAQNSLRNLRYIILQVVYPRISLCTDSRQNVLDDLIHCNLVFSETDSGRIRVEVSLSNRRLTPERSSNRSLEVQVHQLLVRIFTHRSLIC